MASPRCRYCGHRVWRWQGYGGWGPVGFSPKTARILFHMRCRRKTPEYLEIKRMMDNGTWVWGGDNHHGKIDS